MWTNIYCCNSRRRRAPSGTSCVQTFLSIRQFCPVRYRVSTYSSLQCLWYLNLVIYCMRREWFSCDKMTSLQRGMQENNLAQPQRPRFSSQQWYSQQFAVFAGEKPVRDLVPDAAEETATIWSGCLLSRGTSACIKLQVTKNNWQLCVYQGTTEIYIIYSITVRSAD